LRDRWEALVASHGLRLDRLESFLDLRAELCEADVRFGQLGEDGLFAQLDRAGLLDHTFPGADNIEHAMANAPSSGRARVRGAVIRGLLDRRAEIACDWDAILDLRSNVCMELSDPLADAEEPWLPNRGDRRGPQLVDWTPYNNRTAALTSYEQGDYRRAEEILRGLVAEGFQLTSTRCHLARVLVMQDRLDEARAEVELAWSARSAGPAYAVRRLLWFRALFAALDGGDVSLPLGQLKAELAGGSANEAWTMGPVLAHVGPRLDVPTRYLLTLLVDVLGGERPVAQLDAMEAWRECAAVAVE
jgi:hypothetical protein